MGKQARQLEEKEIEHAIADARKDPVYGERDALCIMLTHLAGLRVCELAALRWDNFLNHNGAVQNAIRLTNDQTKRNKGRIVPLCDRLQAALAAFLPAGQFAHTNNVIRSKKGVFSPNSLAQRMSSVYARAGLQGASSHSGRRYLVNTLHDRLVPLRYVQEIVGHKDLATTQRYIDAPQHKLIEAIKVFN